MAEKSTKNKNKSDWTSDHMISLLKFEHRITPKKYKEQNKNIKNRWGLGVIYNGAILFGAIKLFSKGPSIFTEIVVKKFRNRHIGFFVVSFGIAISFTFIIAAGNLCVLGVNPLKMYGKQATPEEAMTSLELSNEGFVDQFKEMGFRGDTLQYILRDLNAKNLLKSKNIGSDGIELKQPMINREGNSQYNSLEKEVREKLRSNYPQIHMDVDQKIDLEHEEFYNLEKREASKGWSNSSKSIGKQHIYNRENKGERIKNLFGERKKQTTMDNYLVAGAQIYYDLSNSSKNNEEMGDMGNEIIDLTEHREMGDINININENEMDNMQSICGNVKHISKSNIHTNPHVDSILGDNNSDITNIRNVYTNINTKPNNTSTTTNTKANTNTRIIPKGITTESKLADYGYNSDLLLSKYGSQKQPDPNTKWVVKNNTIVQKPLGNKGNIKGASSNGYKELQAMLKMETNSKKNNNMDILSRVVEKCKIGGEMGVGDKAPTDMEKIAKYLEQEKLKEEKRKINAEQARITERNWLKDYLKPNVGQTNKDEESLRAIVTKERIIELEKIELEDRESKIRFDNRKSTELFLSEIISCRLFTHNSETLSKHPPIPNEFKTHKEYHNTWLPIFHEEAKCQLLKRKEKIVESRKSICNIVKDEVGRVFMKILIKIPQQFETEVKENDLLLLTITSTEVGVGVDPKININTLIACDKINGNTPEFTKHSNKDNQQIYFPCFLQGKKYQNKEMKYIGVTDAQYENIIFKTHAFSVQGVLIYMESISTLLREYKILNMSEFFTLKDYILTPSILKKNILYNSVVLEKLKKYEEYVAKNPRHFTRARESKNWTVDLSEDSAPRLPINEEMYMFMRNNKGNYNESQIRALRYVSAMKEKDIVLIQGPPGTGKTHTILGLIGMIMSKQQFSRKIHIMICAPSNIAIDEIITRISKNKLETAISGKKYKPSLVRIGILDDPSTIIKESSLDYQISIQMKKSSNPVITKAKIQNKLNLIDNLINKHNPTSNTKNLKEGDITPINTISQLITKEEVKPILATKEISEFILKQSITEQIEYLKRAKAILTGELRLTKLDKNQRREQQLMLEKRILEEANMICCTLSSSGIERLDQHEFDYLIIDEACQCVELSSLIPFQYKVNKVILVGDHKQLPPTTILPEYIAHKLHYNRSLFERILNSEVDTEVLTEQYRMEPSISMLSSVLFYHGAIINSPSINTRIMPQFIVKQGKLFFPPFIFFDMKNSKEAGLEGDTSIYNPDETKLIHALLPLIMGERGSMNNQKDLKKEIGIISPYKRQVKVIRSMLGDEYIKNSGGAIQVNTIDSFQGREKDIIIFSCVRAGNKIGFLADSRRMNVAITRAKYILIVIGNSNTLKYNYYWMMLIEYARLRGTLIELPTPVINKGRENNREKGWAEGFKSLDLIEFKNFAKQQFVNFAHKKKHKPRYYLGGIKGVKNENAKVKEAQKEIIPKTEFVNTKRDHPEKNQGIYEDQKEIFPLPIKKQKLENDREREFQCKTHNPTVSKKIHPNINTTTTTTTKYVPNMNIKEKNGGNTSNFQSAPTSLEDLVRGSPSKEGKKIQNKSTPKKRGFNLLETLKTMIQCLIS